MTVEFKGEDRPKEKHMPSMTAKYVDRNFDILSVLNGTAGENSPNAYSVKFSLLKVSNTSIPTKLEIKCTHQNNTFKNAHRSPLDTFLMKKRDFPTWPQINSEVTLAAYTNLEMGKKPLEVQFVVNT